MVAILSFDKVRAGITCRVKDGEWLIQEYNTENRISSIMKLAEGICDIP
jgi:hypothetical protein